MIVFLLLIIIAIMLLGASRFIGMVGIILGGIALVLALFFGIVAIAKATGAETGDVLLYFCGAGLVVAFLAGMAGVGKTPS